MPRGDGTGPAGFGPMTGRAAGYCAGYAVPGFMNPVAGRGFRGWGRGRGFGGGGRGWRHWYYATGVPGWMRAGWPAAAPTAPYSKQEEAESLKQQAEFLEQSLNEIKKRLVEMEEAPKET